MRWGVMVKKIGMTRVFLEDGSAIPVTVLQDLNNRVSQIKTPEKDGYAAIQVCYGEQSIRRINQPMQGHLQQAGIQPGRGFFELLASPDALAQCTLGQPVPLSVLSSCRTVDVMSVSKGKGFAGTVKRHHFRIKDASHGNSLSHRTPGSIGQRQTPGRVFKGKRMAGHMGHARCTVQALKLVKVDESKGLLLIQGSCPGPAGAVVRVLPSIKQRHAGGDHAS